MSKSPPGTFVPRDLFGTTFQQTSDLLDAFFHWTEANETTEEARSRKVRTLIDEHTKSGSPQRDFWDQAYQSVYAWTNSTSDEEVNGEFPSFSIGLRPFTFVVEYNNRKALESVMTDWWTPSGSASKKRFPIPTSSTFPSPSVSRDTSLAPSISASGRSSRSQSRSRSRSRSQSAISVDANLRTSETQARTASPKTSARTTETSTRTTGTSARSRRQASESSSTAPYSFQGDLAGTSSRRNPSSSRRENQPASSSNPSTSRPFPQSNTLVIDSDTEPEEDNNTLEEQIAQLNYEKHWKTKIAQSQARNLRSVPEHLKATFSLIERNRWAANETLVKEIARAGSAYQIPLKARMAMVKYQYVDLREIYGFDRSASVQSRLLPDDDGLNFHFDPALPKEEIPSIVAWLDTFGTYSKYIKYLYPDLAEDLDYYAEWMRYQNVHIYTDRWRAYLELDVFIRKHLTTDNFPYTLTASVSEQSHIVRFLTNPSFISSSDSSRASKRPRLASNEICLRYQDKRCPGGDSCRGRIHECENCGGDHPGQDCTAADRSATTERLERRAAMGNQAGTLNSGSRGNSGSAGTSGGGHPRPRAATVAAAQPAT